MSSSFIVLSHPKLEFTNAIRIGTILYGFDIAPKRLSNSPKNILRKIRNNYLIKKYNISKTYDNVNIELKTALKLKTNIIQIKHIKQGDKVGYGILYEAKKDADGHIVENKDKPVENPDVMDPEQFEQELIANQPHHQIDFHPYRLCM